MRSSSADKLLSLRVMGTLFTYLAVQRGEAKTLMCPGPLEHATFLFLVMVGLTTCAMGTM